MDFDELTNIEQEQIRLHVNGERTLNAVAVAEFLLHQTGGDTEAALRIADAEDERRLGRDYGFWREVMTILRQPDKK